MEHGQFGRWGRSQTEPATTSAAAQDDKMTEGDVRSRRPFVLQLCSLPRKAAATVGGRRKGRRARLTYANVVSTLALFFALSGVAYAAAQWTGADIVDESLTGADVKNESLGQADLGTDSVAFNELAFNAVTSGHIMDGQVKTHDAASDFKAPDAAKLGGVSAQNYLRSHQIVTKSLTVGPFGAAGLTVECPLEKVVLGGGYGLPNNNNIWVISNHPVSAGFLGGVRVPSGWRVDVRNSNAFTFQVTAHAVCASAA